MNEQPRALRFRAGGLELAVLLPEIAHIVEPRPVVAVPYAHPALAGLLIDEHRQMPVFELRGMVDPRAPFDRTLPYAALAIFDTELGEIGLRVETVRGTVENYERIEETDPSVDDALRPVLAGRASDGGNFHFFSPGAFLIALDVLKPLRPS